VVVGQQRWGVPADENIVQQKLDQNVPEHRRAKAVVARQSSPDLRREFPRQLGKRPSAVKPLVITMVLDNSLGQRCQPRIAMIDKLRRRS
jgi:hypothetical protein